MIKDKVLVVQTFFILIFSIAALLASVKGCEMSEIANCAVGDARRKGKAHDPIACARAIRGNLEDAK